MSKVSFEDIGMVTATFAAREDMKPGQVVKITGNGEVKGFACLPTSGTVTLGRVKLAADGTGGVKPVSTGGTEVLVVSADNSGHTAVVCL